MRGYCYYSNSQGHRGRGETDGKYDWERKSVSQKRCGEKKNEAITTDGNTYKGQIWIRDPNKTPFLPWPQKLGVSERVRGL